MTNIMYQKRTDCMMCGTMFMCTRMMCRDMSGLCVRFIPDSSDSSTERGVDE